MISLRLLTRNATPQLAASTQHLHTSKILFDTSSSDSDTSDDEKQKKKVAETKQGEVKGQPSHRINSLLLSMIQQSKTPSKVDVALNPNKAKKVKPQNAENRSSGSITKHLLFEDKLTGAAKDVAASLGGDTRKIESELLKKILTPNTNAQEPIELGKLVRGMNVDHGKSKKISPPSNRADQVRNAMKRYGAPEMSKQRNNERYQQAGYEKDHEKDLLDSGTLLNVFNLDPQALPDPNTPMLETWDFLEKKEFQMLVTHPPRNVIEQMIQWTEQGRLWNFPINNEQGLNIDQEEHFSEHVFLEQHLEDWCPTKGPIRHFMELVCVGLSKNPYLSVKEKKEHIVWFKEYFAGKHDLLKELGAYGTGEKSAGNKQIDA